MAVSLISAPDSLTNPFSSPLGNQFRATRIDQVKCSLAAYNRRDYYKISLILTGCSKLIYADKDIPIDRPALVFTNPLVPYSWESIDPPELYSGYFCIFTDAFLRQGTGMASLEDSMLFKPGGQPVYNLDNNQISYLSQIFNRMIIEVQGEYLHKHELIRSQLHLILHEAIKMQPATAYQAPTNAATRITRLFLELLQRQFPVESALESLKLRSAGDFATNLSIHVNHLNAAVQEVTGKSTSTHITERVISEARSLLLHTDWSVAEVSAALGFEYPSYFNNFFKKHTGTTPGSLRVKPGVN